MQFYLMLMTTHCFHFDLEVWEGEGGVGGVWGQGISHLKEYSAGILSDRKREEEDMRIQGLVL